MADPNIEFDTSAYEDLRLLIQNQEGKIFLANTGRDLREYEKILAVTTPTHDKNHVLNAMACYCRKYGIKIYDDSFSNFSGKLYEMWCFWEAGVSVPDTAFGSTDFLAEALAMFGGIGVLKVTHSSKGAGVFLVHSADEINQIINDNPDKTFILQNFIPNDGDYRVIALDYVPRMAIYRTANGGDFRNSTSLGGQAIVTPLDELDPKILEISAAAAKAFKVRFAGVDITPNKETGQYVVLEVNRTPQITTAPPVEQKAEILKRFMLE